jgi:hypothetical protein
VYGRIGEAAVELDECGATRAPESVDRLVVVADDHDVVRSIWRPTEQLDELDLGDVGVLELVDEDVPVLALVFPENIRPPLEELRDRGDLLTEVDPRRPSIDGGHKQLNRRTWPNRSSH